MAYNRLPGPWKRYADAAGGHADAGGLLDHILLRFRTQEALKEHDGALWIAQSVRCWRQEVPLSERRFTCALQRLERARLIEVKLARISDTSPVRFTHIRLTADGEKFLAKRKMNHADRKRRLPRSGKAGSSTVMEPVQSTECQNRLFTESSERRTSEISLAPYGAREEGTGKTKKKNLKEKGEKKEREDTGLAREVETIWRDAMQKHHPKLPCSSFYGPKWQYAHRIAQVLGLDVSLVIDAVVRDWRAFTGYLENHGGVRTFSVEPDIVCLAIHIDAACRWVELQEIERREEEQREVEFRVAQVRIVAERQEREERAKDQRREEYAHLMASAATTRANIEDAIRQLDELPTLPRLAKYDRQRNERAIKEYIGERERDIARCAELEAEFGQPASLTIEDEPLGGCLLGPPDHR